MLRYIYYRCCKHHEKGKRENKIDLQWSRFYYGLIMFLFTPVGILIMSILDYNTFTLIIAGVIYFALTLAVEHHIKQTSKHYRPPQRYKALNKMSMATLAWAVILPLEIIYVICSMILTIKFLVVPLHLDGLLARWLSGLF